MPPAYAAHGRLRMGRCRVGPLDRGHLTRGRPASARLAGPVVFVHDLLVHRIDQRWGFASPLGSERRARGRHDYFHTGLPAPPLRRIAAFSCGVHIRPRMYATRPAMAAVRFCVETSGTGTSWMPSPLTVETKQVAS